MPETKKLFYILSLKHTRGNYITWWGPASCGYATDLNHAGLYSEEEVTTHRLNDGVSTMAIPEADVLQAVSRVVSTNHLNTLCKQPMYQTADGPMTQTELDKEAEREKKKEAERQARIAKGEECAECGGRGGCNEWCRNWLSGEGAE